MSKLKLRMRNGRYVIESRNKKNSTVDHYKLSVCNIGFLGGDILNIRKSILHERSKSIWKAMIYRCYKQNSRSYAYYGEKGVTVSDSWLNYSNFFNDIKTLKGWNDELFLSHNITLDKDKLQTGSTNKIYSKDTCCWLTMSEQHEFVNRYGTITSPDNEITFICIDGESESIHTSITKFCKPRNLSISAVSSCILGKRNSHKGYKFKPYIEKCND